MSTTTNTDAHVGRVLLGKYRIEHVLGEGGMGLVVAARHLDLGQLFAIKLMLPAALADADAVERFLREARAAARLKSEHVARVQDVGRLEDGAPYMVMEHLSGQDLKQVLRARGALPPLEAITYVYQACEAVAEAHALGVVHRDLKPANLFLTQRLSGTPCVKVLDFGISKDLDPAQRVGPDLTKTGVIMGSPYYMSPEQLTNIKETDPRSDIWSLGVILFELLTGARPFATESLIELLSKIATVPPPRPSELRPDLAPDLEAIVMKCLEKPRERRFQSVRDLMGALLPFMPADRVSTVTPMGTRASLAGPIDIEAHTTKVWAESSAPGKRRGHAKVAAGVGVAMGVALLIGGGAWFVRGRDSSSDTAAASGSPALAIPAVTAPAPPTIAPEAVVVPAKSVQDIEWLDTSREPPPVVSAAPSASASGSAQPDLTGGKPKKPLGGRAPNPSGSTGPAASAPPAVDKVPDFNQ
jgi:hypothetical protein